MKKVLVLQNALHLGLILNRQSQPVHISSRFVIGNNTEHETHKWFIFNSEKQCAKVLESSLSTFLKLTRNFVDCWETCKFNYTPPVLPRHDYYPIRILPGKTSYPHIFQYAVSTATSQSPLLCIIFSNVLQALFFRGRQRPDLTSASEWLVLVVFVRLR